MQVEKERSGWVIFYRKFYIQNVFSKKGTWRREGEEGRKKEAPVPLFKENNSWLCLLRRCRLIEACFAVHYIHTHIGRLLSPDEAQSGLSSHSSSRSWIGLGLHVLNQPRQTMTPEVGANVFSKNPHNFSCIIGLRWHVCSHSISSL